MKLTLLPVFLLSLLFFTIQSNGASVPVKVHEINVLDYSVQKPELNGRLTAAYLAAENGAMRIVFDRGGLPYLLSRTASKGVLTRLDTGQAAIESDLLKSITLKSLVDTPEGWLAAIDYWPAKSSKRGIYLLSRDGKERKLALKENYDGLGDIIAASDGGWLFADFEKNNIYHLAGEDKEETSLLKQDAPKGIIRLVWNPLEKRLYVGSMHGNWPFAKTAGIYRVEKNKAIEVYQPEQVAGMDWSTGKLFPRGMYFSNPEKGTIERLTDQGAEVVIQGLRRPGDIHFDPRSGALWVISDDYVVLRFSTAQDQLLPGMKPLLAGISTIKGAAAARAKVTVNGKNFIMDKSGHGWIDGISTGTHKVKVIHHGYQLHEKSYSLKPAETLELGIQPTAQLDISGHILTADAQPLVGAIVKIDPIDSNALPHGNYTFVTNTEGYFSILSIPAGVYRISISAPLHQSLVSKQKWLLSQNKLQFVLKPLSVKSTRRNSEKEPNNRENQALELAPGQSVSGLIQPLKDVDWYRVHISRPGQLVITMQEHPDMQQHLQVFAAADTGKLLADKGTNPNNPLVIKLDVTTGDYLLKFQEWGSNNTSKQPYIMKLDFISDDGVDDPEIDKFPLKAVRKLELHRLQGSTIWPLGDQDLYRIDLPGSGLLKISGKAPFQLLLKLFSEEGKLLAERGANSGVQAHISYQPLQSGSVYLQVQEWGNNNASTSPYRVEADWFLADANDYHKHNDALISAVPIRDGTLLNGNILPLKDHDYYRIRVEHPGELRIHAEKTPGQRLVRILDQQGKVAAERGVNSDQVLDVSVSVLPGSWYIDVSEWGNNSIILSDYRIQVNLNRAEPEESEQLANDPVRELLPDSGRSFFIDQVADQDRFKFIVPESGLWVFNMVTPFQVLMKVEKKGADKPLLEKGWNSGNKIALPLKLEAGDELLITLREWGDNSRSDQPGFILVSRQTYNLAADAIQISPGAEAGEVALSRKATVMPRPLTVVFDADSDGKIDLDISAEQIVIWQYPKPGIYQAQITMTGRKAQVMTDGLWVKKGAAWNSPGTLIWKDQTQTFDLDFGKNINLAALNVQLDNNDSYEISSSLDGKQFTKLIHISADIGKLNWGMDRFSSESDNENYHPSLRFKPLQVRYLRLQAMSGDKSFSVAELQGVDSAGKPLSAIPVGLDYQIRQSIWIDARDAADQVELQLDVEGLNEGEILEQEVPIIAFARASVGAHLKEVVFMLDGKPLSILYKPPFKIDIPWNTLGNNTHILEIEARDTRGKKKKIQRKFKLADYFGLQPSDGSQSTGTSRWISWTGSRSGPAKVFHRLSGEQQWHKTEGERGRERRVLLSGLVSGAKYEFYIETQDGRSPVRQFSLLKGLAFGQSSYGTVINRDYDQRVGVSVRNNGDKPLNVLLKCAKPDDPLLLAGFVGEGSQDKPFLLKAGEEKRFMLGISAQDVMTARHRFPIQIIADNGLTDEAEVSVWVRLPRIDLKWKDLGADKDGIGRLYELKNEGDTITDLSVQAKIDNEIIISPSVTHGLLSAGQTMQFQVRPRFYKNFRGVETTLIAAALDKQFVQNYKLQLKPGETAHQVWLFPGMTPEEQDDQQLQKQLADNVKRSNKLDPKTLDWNQGESEQDVDGNGMMDRWTLTAGDVRWVGDDSSGDGIVDFVHADVGDNGIYEYSAYFKDNSWRKTNLVEAWLEMGFSLPWSRSAYEPHDLEILFNGRTIGQLKNTIPEGNYSFRIPPASMNFDSKGMPTDNEVGIQSRHLRGGHYVVNSDFRFKFRLTATPIWTIASSEKEARSRVSSLNSIDTLSIDVGISSAAMKVEGPAEPKAGDAMTVLIPLRNMASRSPNNLLVALYRIMPDGSRVELAQRMVRHLSVDGVHTVELPFRAPGGANTLKVILDPDDDLKDVDKSNNQASFFLKVSGDDRPPTVKINYPADNAELNSGLNELKFVVKDDQELALVQVSVDGGLWQDQKLDKSKHSLKLLLQPGDHELLVRASDATGNITSKKVRLSVAAELPDVTIQSPAHGFKAASRTVKLILQSKDKPLLIAARSNHGPWHKATMIKGGWGVQLPISFGHQNIDVMAVSRHGIVSRASTIVQCTQQADKGSSEAESALADQGIVWLGNNLEWQIDMFEQQSGILKKASLSRDQRAVILIKDAEYRQAVGDYAGAMNKYQESLLLKQNPLIKDRFKRLEFFLKLR